MRNMGGIGGYCLSAGVFKLKKRAVGNYSEIGDAKCEWADKIGRCLRLHENISPSYQYFIGELEKRILAS